MLKSSPDGGVSRNPDCDGDFGKSFSSIDVPSRNTLRSLRATELCAIRVARMEALAKILDCDGDFGKSFSSIDVPSRNTLRSLRGTELCAIRVARLLATGT